MILLQVGNMTDTVSNKAWAAHLRREPRIVYRRAKPSDPEADEENTVHGPKTFRALAKFIKDMDAAERGGDVGGVLGGRSKKQKATKYYVEQLVIDSSDDLTPYEWIPARLFCVDTVRIDLVNKFLPRGFADVLSRIPGKQRFIVSAGTAPATSHAKFWEAVKGTKVGGATPMSNVQTKLKENLEAFSKDLADNPDRIREVLERIQKEKADAKRKADEEFLRSLPDDDDDEDDSEDEDKPRRGKKKVTSTSTRVSSRLQSVAEQKAAREKLEDEMAAKAELVNAKAEEYMKKLAAETYSLLTEGARADVDRRLIRGMDSLVSSMFNETVKEIRGFDIKERMDKAKEEKKNKDKASKAAAELEAARVAGMGGGVEARSQGQFFKSSTNTRVFLAGEWSARNSKDPVVVPVEGHTSLGKVRVEEVLRALTHVISERTVELSLTLTVDGISLDEAEVRIRSKTEGANEFRIVPLEIKDFWARCKETCRWSLAQFSLYVDPGLRMDVPQMVEALYGCDVLEEVAIVLNTDVSEIRRSGMNTSPLIDPEYMMQFVMKLSKQHRLRSFLALGLGLMDGPTRVITALAVVRPNPYLQFFHLGCGWAASLRRGSTSFAKGVKGDAAEVEAGGEPDVLTSMKAGNPDLKARLKIVEESVKESTRDLLKLTEQWSRARQDERPAIKEKIDRKKLQVEERTRSMHRMEKEMTLSGESGWRFDRLNDPVWFWKNLPYNLAMAKWIRDTWEKRTAVVGYVSTLAEVPANVGPTMVRDILCHIVGPAPELHFRDCVQLGKGKGGGGGGSGGGGGGDGGDGGGREQEGRRKRGRRRRRARPGRGGRRVDP